MNLKTTISQLIILSTLILNLSAMSRKTAKILTATTTATVAGLMGRNYFNYVKDKNEELIRLNHLYKDDNYRDYRELRLRFEHKYENEKFQKMIRNLLIVVGTAILSKKMFFGHTSKGFLERAKSKHINSMKLRSLVDSNNFDKAIIDKNLKSFYTKSEFPQVEAFNDINKLDYISKNIVELLQQSKNTIDSEQEVKNEADELLKEYNPEFFNRLEQAILTIAENPNFIIALKTINKNEEDANKFVLNYFLGLILAASVGLILFE